jgi:signal transduction histidine kinase
MDFPPRSTISRVPRTWPPGVVDSGRRGEHGDLTVSGDVSPGSGARDPADLERTLAALESALESRDAFLRLATHELRGPLAAIQLQADTISLLVRQGASLSEIDGRAVRVGRLVQKLARLLEEVLDLARASSGRLALQPGEVDIATLVRGELERLRDDLARLGCGVKVEGPVRMMGRWDQARMEHVIGALTAAVARAGAGEPISIELGAEPGGARVELRGAGGIPEPQRSLAFADFGEAVHGNSPGQNVLSLWLARTIVEAHGGHLELDDRGAVLTIPASRSPEGEKLARGSRR